MRTSILSKMKEKPLYRGKKKISVCYHLKSYIPIGSFRIVWGERSYMSCSKSEAKMG